MHPVPLLLLYYNVCNCFLIWIFHTLWALSAETGYFYYERDGGVSSALYNFWDATYGEISLEFYVEGPGGFYLHLPN